MSKMDFLEYSRPNYESIRNRNFHEQNWNNDHNNRGNTVMKYHLEHKDGNLQSHSICLEKSAEQVLISMSSALKDSGISGIPSPPTTALQNNLNDNLEGNHSPYTHFSNSLWGAYSYNNYNNNKQNGENDSSHNYYNRQFNIHSNRGRHLQSFLHNESLCSDEIILRNKRHRLDAIAVASLAREAYQFQAIDGVTNSNKMMSSLSFTKTLQALLVCHDEHCKKFHVSSFYPLRLIFSHDDPLSPKLDIYGGTLSINPAATQEQWLQQSLLTVTPNKLQTLAYNQKRLKKHIHFVQKHLQIKIKKGHSCTSYEYHDLLHRLANHCTSTTPTTPLSLYKRIANNHTVAFSKLVTVVIESSQLLLYYTRRRGVVDSNTGFIQVSAGMNIDAICHSIDTLRDEAIQTYSEQEHLQAKCNELVKMCQYQLGIANINCKTYKITKHQIIQCLSRLLLEQNQHFMNNDNYEEYNGDNDASTFTDLAGKSISITNSGQHCHLGDDGSIMIPWDWL